MYKRPRDEDDDLMQGSVAGGGTRRGLHYILIRGAGPKMKMVMGRTYTDRRKIGKKF